MGGGVKRLREGVKRLREVVVETKWKGMMVVEKQKAMFVYDTQMSFQQMPLTCSPKTQRFAYVKLLANPYKSCAIVL